MSARDHIDWAASRRQQNLNRHDIRNYHRQPDPSRPHHFTIFRLGMDACAKCGKPRAEHQLSSEGKS